MLKAGPSVSGWPPITASDRGIYPPDLWSKLGVENLNESIIDTDSL